MDRAAIVVLTFNTERFVDSCFGSLGRARLGGAEVIAVDNGSKDGTVRAIRERFPWVTIVETGANLGFAGGNDVGMRRALDAGAEWIYLLNPDTEVDQGFLEEAMAVAEADPRAGAVQSLLLLDPERERVNSCGNEIHFLGFGYCGGYRTLRGEAPGEPREIAFASGAASLWRAGALREVGLLDEALFLYHEDLDLGWRLRVAGWRARLAPRSVVFHHYEFSRNRQKYFFLERNRYLVLGKNLRLRSLLVLAPFLAAAELGILAVALTAGWLPEKLRADLALLRPANWRRLAAARREVQRTRRAPDREVMSVFTPVIAFDGLEGGWIPKLLAGPMRLVWKVIRPLLG
jgi:N-acetylglucosaminyl-diphospho-decaprenol L-rhamnosyltransferase